MVKNICFIVAFFITISPAQSQLINWVTETGLNGGNTFVDGQVINNFAGTGLNVRLNVVVVNGFPKINAGDPTKVNISDANEATFTFTILNGTSNVLLNNHQNLLRGEQIRLSNPSGQNITIQETASNGGARMTVDAVAMTGPLPSTIVQNNVAIIREQNNGAGTAWNASMSDVAGFTWTYKVMAGFSANEGFSLTLNNIVLPVELVDFDAKIREDVVELMWETASETNNDYFTIERSEDGRFWENIGAVAGQGTSSLSTIYQFIDKHPFTNLSYYRLKQTDFDGQFSYSDINSVFVEKKQAVKIFPNPATDFIFISNIDFSESELIITDVIGRAYNDLVKIDRLDASTLRIDLNRLQPGVYFMVTPSNSIRKTIQLRQ